MLSGARSWLRGRVLMTASATSLACATWWAGVPELAGWTGRGAADGGRAKASPAVTYRTVTAYDVPMHVVQVDPRRPEVRIAVATAGKGLGHQDGWSQMIDRTRPAAAITGTYFCTTSFLPVGSIVAGGRVVHRGAVGSAFAFAPGQGGSILSCLPGETRDWSDYDTVLRAGPRLLAEGGLCVWPQVEGFHDPAIFRYKSRAAVAVTRQGKLLFVAVRKPVKLLRLAGALKAIGAVDAMCMDGGGSTGLYYRGKSRVVPRRPLTNLLVIYDSKARYDRYAGRLVPGRRRVARPAVRPALRASAGSTPGLRPHQ